MGTYYYYVNHSKKQIFSVDPLGALVKKAFVGMNIGSVCLHHLLSNDLICDHSLCGSWIGDTVEVVADASETYDRASEEYTEMDVEVFEMLVECEGVAAIRRLLGDSATQRRVVENEDLPVHLRERFARHLSGEELPRLGFGEDTDDLRKQMSGMGEEDSDEQEPS